MTVLGHLDKLKSILGDIELSITNEISLGVITTNTAFILAKKQKANPVEIAKKLKTDWEIILEKNLPELKVSNVGPYLNFDLNTNYLADFLLANQAFEIPRSADKVLIDFVGANSAKNLHMGHTRNLNLGESICRILSLRYPDLVTENYWGDWGVQFGIILWSYKQLLEKKQISFVLKDQQILIDISDYQTSPVKVLSNLYVWGNLQKDTVPEWDALVRNEFLLLEQKDQQNHDLWQHFNKVSKENIIPDLKFLNVRDFDYEYGEAYYHNLLGDLTVFLDENNIWEKEGKARYFDFEKLVEKWPNLDLDLKQKISNLGRCYLISSGGYTGYAYRDVMARISWVRDLDKNYLITITGNEQLHHFKQVFAIVNYLANLPEFAAYLEPKVLDKLKSVSLYHISYGFLTLETGKMSSRKGTVLSCQEFLQNLLGYTKNALDSKTEVLDRIDSLKNDDTVKKVAVAALKWYDLARDSQLDMVFNQAQVLSFEGNTGVYQLYTVARINSILNKLNFDELENLQKSKNILEKTSLDKNLNSEEIELLKILYHQDAIVQRSIETLKPHHICNYLYELASSFNKWYSKNSIVSEKNPDRQVLLLRLVFKVKQYLVAGLDLLAIETVDRL